MSTRKRSCSSMAAGDASRSASTAGICRALLAAEHAHVRDGATRVADREVLGSVAAAVRATTGKARVPRRRGAGADGSLRRHARDGRRRSLGLAEGWRHGSFSAITSPLGARGERGSAAPSTRLRRSSRGNRRRGLGAKRVWRAHGHGGRRPRGTARARHAPKALRGRRSRGAPSRRPRAEARILDEAARVRLDGVATTTFSRSHTTARTPGRSPPRRRGGFPRGDDRAKAARGLTQPDALGRPERPIRSAPLVPRAMARYRLFRLSTYFTSCRRSRLLHPRRTSRTRRTPWSVKRGSPRPGSLELDASHPQRRTIEQTAKDVGGAASRGSAKRLKQRLRREGGLRILGSQ